MSSNENRYQDEQLRRRAVQRRAQARPQGDKNRRSLGRVDTLSRADDSVPISSRERSTSLPRTRSRGLAQNRTNQATHSTRQQSTHMRQQPSTRTRQQRGSRMQQESRTQHPRVGRSHHTPSRTRAQSPRKQGIVDTLHEAYSNLSETYGSNIVLTISIIAAIMALLLIVSLVRGCAGMVSGATSEDSTTTLLAASDESSTTGPSKPRSFVERTTDKVQTKLQEEKANADQVALLDILTEDLVQQLEERAKTNPDARWIAAHPSAYDSDGPEVQQKILQLAAEEEAALTYIRNWPELFERAELDLESENALPVAKTGIGVPRLYQWDPRWGYTTYSSASFGLTGCCPTALSMVYEGLTGNTDMNPYEMALLAQNGGYMATYEGTDSSFLINEAPGLGMDCTMLNISGDDITAALEAGQVLIANVGPGDFTVRRHFIVLTGLENGKVVVNDPYSKVHSDMLWDADQIAQQTSTLLAYYAL